MKQASCCQTLKSHQGVQDEALENQLLQTPLLSPAYPVLGRSHAGMEHLLYTGKSHLSGAAGRGAAPVLRGPTCSDLKTCHLVTPHKHLAKPPEASDGTSTFPVLSKGTKRTQSPGTLQLLIPFTVPIPDLRARNLLPRVALQNRYHSVERTCSILPFPDPPSTV